MHEEVKLFCDVKRLYYYWGKDYSFETDEKQDLRYVCFCGV